MTHRCVQLLAVGLTGDRDGRWTNRPFLTNVVSAATGASFGIPIALLVLGHLSNRQREYLARQIFTAERDRTLARIGRYAWRIHDMTVPGRTDAELRAGADDIWSLWDDIHTEWDAFKEYVVHGALQQRVPDVQYTVDLYGTLIEALDEQRHAFQDAVKSGAALPTADLNSAARWLGRIASSSGADTARVE